MTMTNIGLGNHNDLETDAITWSDLKLLLVGS